MNICKYLHKKQYKRIKKVRTSPVHTTLAVILTNAQITVCTTFSQIS